MGRSVGLLVCLFVAVVSASLLLLLLVIVIVALLLVVAVVENVFSRKLLMTVVNSDIINSQ